MQQDNWISTPCNRKSGFNIHRIVGSGNVWSYPEHTHHGFCELTCATSGVFQHVINGKPHTQIAGEIIFIRENDAHLLVGRKFNFVNVMFHPDWLKRIELFIRIDGIADALLKSPDAPRAIIPAKERKSYRQTLERLLNNSADGLGLRFFAAFLVTMLVCRLAPYSDHEFPDGLPDWLRRTLVWISGNRENIPSLAEIVKNSGRCHEHFTREFSRHMGIAPSNYLTALRIDYAADMLVLTNDKLMDICHAAGFENEAYFFRAFRKRKGITPNAFRRKFGQRIVQR